MAVGDFTHSSLLLCSAEQDGAAVCMAPRSASFLSLVLAAQCAYLSRLIRLCFHDRYISSAACQLPAGASLGGIGWV